MNAIPEEVKAGDLIGNDGSVGFNHGCRDYSVMEYIGDGKAKVIEAQSCTSCWQVGHDQDHVFAEIGEVLDITIYKDIEPAGKTFSGNVKWEIVW